MPVQMIELEEVKMLQTSDEVLEALVTVRVFTGVGGGSAECTSSTTGGCGMV
ncbi:hypothetical protein SAMN06295945_0994 [Polynucleobacter meluiroseus]|uniref:Uncharacterized protein n=1 Tax=Polynucleobacter meluiroseus TaxID=1938814 RepID=A0A240E170_9BURK|nr:hypothetical protein [Polynucleobacter meluiroseus]SNX28654.1 hypothetical protein SAMN06295945_0994 [Polynucleobacter meluiroseus]